MALQMSTTPDAVRTQGSPAELEPLLASVEQRLTDLQSALSARDMPCIELHATELQRSLAQAVERFMQVARQGGVPLDLRRRLARAGAQVASQRDALACATAALDCAIDVLMPGFGGVLMVYSVSGTLVHSTLSGCIQV
jgi:hypothetical protein